MWLKRNLVFVFAVALLVSAQYSFAEGEDVSKDNEFKLGEESIKHVTLSMSTTGKGIV